MTAKILRLTLTVEVSVTSERPLGLTEEELRVQLERQFGDWRDGRYPFSVEQVHDGLRRNVTSAIENVVDQQLHDRYPYNPQRLSPGIAVTSTVAMQRTQGLSVQVYGGRIGVPEIEEVDPWTP